MVNKKYHIDDLLSCKDLLTPKQIEALELRKRGLTYYQISLEFDISTGSVNKLLKRAKMCIMRSAGIIVNITENKAGTQLTPRESEVWALKHQGFTNADIAEKLDISISTVKGHVRNARIRLRAREQLTPEQSETLELQRQGFTYRQISERLNITPQGVCYRLTQARKHIKAKELQSEQ